jgi:tetratricopeptide (TPR) repeat protein
MDATSVNRLVLSWMQHLAATASSETDKANLSVGIDCFADALGLSAADFAPSDELQTLLSAPNAPATPIAPSGPEEKPEDRAVALKVEGNAALKAGDIPKAIELYSAAIDAWPLDATFFANRAYAYALRKDFSNAAADCEDAVSLKPDYHKAHFRLGQARLELAQPAAAVDAFSAALESDPGNATYKQMLAQARAALARNREESAARSAPAGAEASANPLAGLMSNPAFASMAQTLMGNMGAGGPRPAASETEAAAQAVPPSTAEVLGQLKAMGLELDPTDPEIQRLLASQKLPAMISAVQSNPMSAMQYLSDPDVAPVISKLLPQLMGSFGRGGKPSGPTGYA